MQLVKMGRLERCWGVMVIHKFSSTFKLTAKFEYLDSKHLPGFLLSNVLLLHALFLSALILHKNWAFITIP
jgi:hypothetical protein